MHRSAIDRILNEEHYRPYSSETPPRWVRTSETPPLETRGKHTVAPGDLVVWNVRAGQDPHYYSPRLGSRACGIVLETRWSIIDWDGDENLRYEPEASIMWNDGQVTNSHQSTVRKVTASVIARC